MLRRKDRKNYRKFCGVDFAESKKINQNFQLFEQFYSKFSFKTSHMHLLFAFTVE